MYNQSNNKRQTIEEMALCHLNCKDYLDIYNIYKDIKNFQNSFNSNIEQFLKDIRNDLLKLSESQNEINMLLRYYLIKVVDANRSRRPHDLSPIDQPFATINNGSEKIRYPFSKTEEKKIRMYMHDNFNGNISSINVMNDMTTNLNGLISKFNEQLKRICDNDIKGICSKEKQLLIKYKIKSIFHLC
jgi:hypothetical protein